MQCASHVVVGLSLGQRLAGAARQVHLCAAVASGCRAFVQSAVEGFSTQGPAAVAPQRVAFCDGRNEPCTLYQCATVCPAARGSAQQRGHAVCALLGPSPPEVVLKRRVHLGIEQAEQLGASAAVPMRAHAAWVRMRDCAATKPSGARACARARTCSYALERSSTNAVTSAGPSSLPPAIFWRANGALVDTLQITDREVGLATARRGARMSERIVY